MKRLLLLSATIIALCSCGFPSSKTTGQGDGTPIDKDFVLSGFDAVDVSGAFELILEQGDFSVAVEIPDYLEPYLDVRVLGHTLEISYKRVPMNLRNLSKGRSVARVSMPRIRDIDISGACTLDAAGIDSPDLDIDASGASKVRLSGTFGELSLECTGASSAVIEGSAREFDLDCSGASKTDAKEFVAERADVEVSGASRAIVNAVVKLDVDCSGASNVQYIVTPKTILRVESSGASSVNAL